MNLLVRQYLVNPDNLEKYLSALQHAANGLSEKEIGALMGISPRTVEWYHQKMMRLLGCKNIAHLVAMAIRYKIID